jgi:hypothetical protein
MPEKIKNPHYSIRGIPLFRSGGSSMEGKQFLSRKELASLLCISLSSVDRGLRARREPFCLCIRIGGRVLFPKDKILDSVLAANTGGSSGAHETGERDSSDGSLKKGPGAND